MRIIGGKYKGRKLILPRNAKTRPTTDFAKEALFNFLADQFHFEDKTGIDLFAGSGSLGFEFLSRGGSFSYFVEIERKNTQCIQELGLAIGAQDQIKVIKADAHKILKAWKAEAVDFIFADPPFSMKEYQSFINALKDSAMTDHQTVIIIEHSSDKDIRAEESCIAVKKYGQIKFTIFNL